ncbi:hypothetical protein E2C01_075104 [Portunus trituberculatus]|uniref:Uncharacterized protein n=1 Tax=Portunus trituberculatus TaxID=210409 RepID=A0A5B7IJ15_PORTR|nr:hypothetical protein [Portunus trituberculatus]
MVRLWRQWSSRSLSPRNGPLCPRLLVAWLPQLRASGLRLVMPLVPDTLCWLILLCFRPLLLLRDPSLLSAPVEFPAYREGSDRHLALEAMVSEMLVTGSRPSGQLLFLHLPCAQDQSGLEAYLRPIGPLHGDSFISSLSLPVARLGQPFSGSGLTVSAGQDSTSVPLEVFAETSCVPSTVSARWTPADAGSAVVPKEALGGCF